jgi:hypothetical protein
MAGVEGVMTQLAESNPELYEHYIRDKKPTTAQIITLPVWADAFRGVPNEILRSALFNARNRKQTRRHYEDEEIAVIGEGQITYRGQELRQDDELVWMQVLHVAKDFPLGEMVEFAPRGFIEAIGWPLCGKSYTRLRTCLSRMQATSIQIVSRRLAPGVSLSLVRKFDWKDTEGPFDRWRIWIEPEIRQLFGEIHYSRVEFRQRKTLPVGIASKLHGYYASHRRPHPVKIETLKRLCGVAGPNKEFLRALREALASLVSVGFLSGWHIDRGLVYVERAQN